MGIEKKLGDIAWNALLLPDRTVKTAVDGLASLISKTGVDRYQVAQAVIIGGGLMAGASMAGYWLSEPRNVKSALFKAGDAFFNLVAYPFYLTPRIRMFSTKFDDVKNIPGTLFFTFTRPIRFPFLAIGISSLFGFYEGLDNIPIPGAAGDWENIMFSAFLYFIDGKTNRWDMAKEWYRRMEGKFSITRTQTEKG
ncbi:hypothetical protein HYY73_01125 [Candidatus Woesearchaeota archaeon]|nr:hypothetical protein [Candidatus Woesearchaeota archaeon]